MSTTAVLAHPMTRALKPFRESMPRPFSRGVNWLFGGATLGLAIVGSGKIAVAAIAWMFARFAARRVENTVYKGKSSDGANVMFAISVFLLGAIVMSIHPILCMISAFFAGKYTHRMQRNLLSIAGQQPLSLEATTGAATPINSRYRSMAEPPPPPPAFVAEPPAPPVVADEVAEPLNHAAAVVSIENLMLAQIDACRPAVQRFEELARLLPSEAALLERVSFDLSKLLDVLSQDPERAQRERKLLTTLVPHCLEVLDAVLKEHAMSKDDTILAAMREALESLLKRIHGVERDVSERRRMQLDVQIDVLKQRLAEPD
jgi:hypothetical protein